MEPPQATLVVWCFSTFTSADKTLCVTIQTKAVEQHVLLFIMLYKVGLTFKPVDETLACDQLNKSY